MRRAAPVLASALALTPFVAGLAGEGGGRADAPPPAARKAEDKAADRHRVLVELFTSQG